MRVYNRLMRIYKQLTLISALMAITLPANADGLYDYIPTASPFGFQQSVITIKTPAKKATLTHTDLQNQYSIAFNKFAQSNVKSAYMDFAVLIESMMPSDYGYMIVAEKLADIGLFNLADIAISKIDDKNISSLLIDDTKRFYYPSKKLSREDEVYLGEVFSNIVYNDQSKEATAELVKNTNLLAESDYANYIAALGYLRSNDFVNARTYIDTAISMNEQNLNYKKLKADILVQSKKTKDALKIAEYIKQQHLYSVDFSNKGNSLEQYILYKSQKNEIKKLYHLGYYYYYEKELGKSIRTLQSAISTKKSTNKDVYALLARVYYDNNDFEKAYDTALKADRLDGGNPTVLLVLGDLSYRSGDYKEALKYYKGAESKSRNNSLPAIRVAQTYEKLDKAKKAMEIYEKVLRTYSDAYLAYYKVALSDKTKEMIYLKKALAINMNFTDAWIDLGRVELERHNFNEAKKYLAVANYIDENNFRYYYYQGLVCKNQGLKSEAVNNFKKSLLLNPDFQPAKEELSI